VLNVDHIKPVSKGGDNTLLNLITSCFNCNSGKSDKEIDDNSAVVRQKIQLDELQSRREQLEMMIQWKEAISANENAAINTIYQKCYDLTGYYPSQGIMNEWKALLKKHGFSIVYDALLKSFDQYAVFKECDMLYSSVVQVIKKVSSIVKYEALRIEDPDVDTIYHLFNIAKKSMYGIPQKREAYRVIFNIVKSKMFDKSYLLMLMSTSDWGYILDLEASIGGAYGS